MNRVVHFEIQAENPERADISTSPEKMADAVLGRMLEGERKAKYKWFLRGMNVLGKTMSREKGDFLKYYYVAMRHLDDIADGDAPHPEGVSIEKYLTQIESFVDARGGQKPKDETEYLLQHCFELGDKFGEDFTQETKYIIGTLLFDVQRRGKVCAERELQEKYFDLDTKGCIRGMLKLVGERPDGDLYDSIQPLAQAVRIYYNLRDFEEDVRARLYNISQEDMRRLGIEVDDLSRGISYEPIKTWCVEQARNGLALMAQFDNTYDIQEKKKFTTFTLHFGYEKNAKKFLEKIVKTHASSMIRE